MTENLEWLVSVASTNEVAMLRAKSGRTGPLWIAADEQLSGRGRSGRGWVSEPGNLYNSLLLTIDRPPMVLAQLALVAGVVVHDTITQLAPQLTPKLKWPNDVLVDGAKICGILIESQLAPAGRGHNVVVGIGLNLAHHPELAERRATSLAAHGIDVSPRQAWQFLSTTFAKWLALWSEGDGFSAICQSWQARAVAIGTQVSVKTGAETISGRFGGLDSDGAMLLELPDGQRRRITFGDVHIGAPPPTDAQGFWR